MWVTYESYRRILFPEEATTVGSEVFKSPIWDTWTICNLDSIETNTGLEQWKIFRSGAGLWSYSNQGNMDTRTTTYLWPFTGWSHYSNVKKTLLWLFAALLCWFQTTKYLLVKCYIVFYSSHQAGTYSP